VKVPNVTIWGYPGCHVLILANVKEWMAKAAIVTARKMTIRGHGERR
jgi:hypothetical protein